MTGRTTATDLRSPVVDIAPTARVNRVLERKGTSIRAFYDAADDVLIELLEAMEKFGSFASPHEGWAVIHEELDELWAHVRANTGRGPAAREEAIQIAAMALRYAIDLTSEVST